MIDDLRHFRADERDGFQLIPRDVAYGILLWAGAMLLILWGAF